MCDIKTKGNKTSIKPVAYLGGGIWRCPPFAPHALIFLRKLYTHCTSVYTWTPGGKYAEAVVLIDNDVELIIYRPMCCSVVSLACRLLRL